MSNRGIVGSLIESHRAKATRPDRRIFTPKTGQLPSERQNAADLEFPAIPQSGTNAPARAEFKLGIFPPDHHVPPAAPPPPTTTTTPKP